MLADRLTLGRSCRQADYRGNRIVFVQLGQHRGDRSHDALRFLGLNVHGACGDAPQQIAHRVQALQIRRDGVHEFQVDVQDVWAAARLGRPGWWPLILWPLRRLGCFAPSVRRSSRWP